jgi:hypothetical protein
MTVCLQRNYIVRSVVDRKEQTRGSSNTSYKCLMPIHNNHFIFWRDAVSNERANFPCFPIAATTTTYKGAFDSSAVCVCECCIGHQQTTNHGMGDLIFCFFTITWLLDDLISWCLQGPIRLVVGTHEDVFNARKKRKCLFPGPSPSPWHAMHCSVLDGYLPVCLSHSYRSPLSVWCTDE